MTFNEDDLSAKLNYSENYTQYTILNITGSYTESDSLKLFSIDENQIDRVYNIKNQQNQNIKWVIVSECEEFNKNFENVMRSMKINAVKKLLINTNQKYFIL